MNSRFSILNSRFNKFRNKLSALLLTVIFGFGILGPLLAPRPVHAQVVTAEAVSVPSVIELVWNKIKDAAMWAWDHGADVAYKSSATYFAKQIAYDTANWVGSGGKGQKPLFITKGWGSYLKDVGDNAAGNFIDEVVKANPKTFEGFNVCDPGVGATAFKLIVSASLLKETGAPSKPKCSFSKMAKNWDKAWRDAKGAVKALLANDPEARRKFFLKNFKVVFNPSENDLGSALILEGKALGVKLELKKANELLLQAGEGLKKLGNNIADTITTPFPRIKTGITMPIELSGNEFTTATGDAIVDGLKVFTSTLAAKLLKRLQEGDVKNPSDDSSTWNFDFGGDLKGLEAAQQVNSTLLVPNFMGDETIDIITEYSNCPQNQPQGSSLPNDCIINSKFADVLRQAQAGKALTVREAVDKKLLDGGWVFKNTEKSGANEQPNAWYWSDLKKLRKARIIPLGWELAAEKFGASSITLNALLTGFNAMGNTLGCGNDATGESEYCGLVDPNWVLRVPPAQCRIKAPGQILVADTGQRAETCVDFQHCVSESNDGSCASWGYCTKEKNIFRFNGESCEDPDGSGYSPYVTCQTYERDNSKVSYLGSSLDSRGCDANNFGCRWYSRIFNPNFSSNTDKYSNNTDTQQNNRLYIRNLSQYSCNDQAEGCSEFLRLSDFTTAAHNLNTAGDNLVEKIVNKLTAVDNTEDYNIYSNQVKKVNLREAPTYLKNFCEEPFNRICVGGTGATKCDNATSTSACVINGGQCEFPGICNNYMSDYLNKCEATEVGCELYTPSDGTPAVPAIISPQDTCPQECVGYNSYTEDKTFFNPSGIQTQKFIPQTARKCSAQTVGCEEFTNVEQGEQRQYYSNLRQCIKPDDVVPDSTTKLAHTYYTWVGADLTGYQLKTWLLQADVPADTGSAPKTTDNSSDCRIERVFPTPDPDCKEFYDVTGAPHYRLASKTITASATCIEYRLTANYGQNDCTSTNGIWKQGACFYRAIATEGKKCTASAVSCREYRGPTANNLTLTFPVSTFGDSISGSSRGGDPTSGWWDGISSSESLTIPGSSYSSGSDAQIERYIPAEDVNIGKTYIITYWAKAQNVGGNETTRPDSITQSMIDTAYTWNIPLDTITGNDWQSYRISAELPEAAANKAVRLVFKAFNGESDTPYVIDNIAFKEVSDNVFVLKNSWNTPNTCTEDQLFCAKYQKRDKTNEYLKSFSNLCRAAAVGCEALIDTRNSDSPRAMVLTGDNAATLNAMDLNKDDQVIYRVYDYKKSCTSNACYRLGASIINSSGEITDWTDTYVRLDPDTFRLTDGIPDSSSPLCVAAADRCAEYNLQSARSQGGVSGTTYVKDPGLRECEYKVADSSHGPDWYKKGTTERCNLLSNGSFENFSGTSGDTIVDSVTNWTTKTTNGGVTERFTIQPSRNVSLGGTYWGGTVVQVESTDRQYSGIWQKITIQPDQNRTRVFTVSAELMIPEGSSNTQPRWEIGTNAVPAGGCSVRNGSGSATCHHYDNVSDYNLRFIPENPEVGKWYHVTATIKIDPNVSSISVTPQTNVGTNASGYMPGKILIDNVQLIESSPERWAYLCPAAMNSCRAFQDFGSGENSDTNTPTTYFYLDNDNLDTSSCNGQVSEREGCRLFNDVSKQATYSSYDTYKKSRENNNQFTAPVNTTTVGPLNTNTILKVRRDRVCGEWLSCQSLSTRTDARTGKSQSICYSLGRCNRWGGANSNGLAACGNWLAPEINPQAITANFYQTRDITWNSPDYSGYSIPNIMPLELLHEKKISGAVQLTYTETVCSNAIGAITVPITVCKSNIDCSDGQFCRGQNIKGVNNDSGSSQKHIEKSCRIYPKTDAPFPAEIVSTTGWKASCSGSECSGLKKSIWLAQTKADGYTNANVCQKDGDCECSYKKANYTNGEELFFDIDVSPDDSFGVGQGNNPEDVVISRLKQVSTFLSNKGYCLEKDTSRRVMTRVNNDPSDNACFTWMPIDVVGGELSPYDYTDTAGLPSTVPDLYMCAHGKQYSEFKYFCIDNNSNDTKCKQFVKVSQPWPTLFDAPEIFKTGQTGYDFSILGTSNICSHGQWNVTRPSDLGNSPAEAISYLKTYYAWGEVYLWVTEQKEANCSNDCDESPWLWNTGRWGGTCRHMYYNCDTDWGGCGFRGEFESRRCSIDECVRGGANEGSRSGYTWQRWDSETVGELDWSNATIATPAAIACMSLVKVYGQGDQEAGVWTDRILRLSNITLSALPVVSVDRNRYGMSPSHIFDVEPGPYGVANTSSGNPSTWTNGLPLFKPMCINNQIPPAFVSAPNSGLCLSDHPQVRPNFHAGLSVPNVYQTTNVGICIGTTTANTGLDNGNTCYADEDCDKNQCIIDTYPTINTNNDAKCVVSNTVCGDYYQYNVQQGWIGDYINNNGGASPPAGSGPYPNSSSTQNPCVAIQSVFWNKDGCNNGKCQYKNINDNTIKIDGSVNCIGTNVPPNDPSACPDSPYNDGCINNLCVYSKKDTTLYTSNRVCSNTNDCLTEANKDSCDSIQPTTYKCSLTPATSCLPSDNSTSCNPNSCSSNLQYNTVNESYIKKLFARGYGIFGWDTTQHKYLSTNQIDGTPQNWSNITNLGVAPKLKGVTYDANNEPLESTDGFSIKAGGSPVMSTDTQTISGSSPMPVTVLFYTYNDNGEQMPLREIIVDWNDDSQSGAMGKYKNYKHICLASSATGYDFGDTPDACVQDGSDNQVGYLSFTHVYTCAPGMTCEFKPRVCVKDNWDWFANGQHIVDGTCDPNSDVWVKFAGKIKLGQ